MTRPRWLETCTHAVLALVLATTVAPRPAALMHHHADGGRAHVHAWGIGAVRSRAEAGRNRDDRGGVTRPRASVVDHMHWQLPYQVAARAAVPQLARVTSTIAVGDTVLLPWGHASSLRTDARAPPA